MIKYIPFLLCVLACGNEPRMRFNMALSPGDPVDSLNGVLVYYNGRIDHVSGRNLAPDGYNLGLKYQCVEFVKRYYYEHYHHKMPDSYGHAKDFFNSSLSDGAVNTRRDLKQFTNGSQSRPKQGDLLVFDATIWNKYGHVAIVSEVKEESIEMIQQNPGPDASSRVTYHLDQEEGLWFIQSSTLLGWLRKKE